MKTETVLFVPHGAVNNSGSYVEVSVYTNPARRHSGALLTAEEAMELGRNLIAQAEKIGRYPGLSVGGLAMDGSGRRFSDGKWA